jgi:selenium-binding protein 1
MRQYDVSDPLDARLTGTVQVGGIVRKAGHPKGGALKGGPQMVEISRDGKRVYFTNGLYSSWDEQFYPEGIPGWMVKLDVKPDGGISVDPGFLATFGEARAHQVRLEGGDASTDTFCFPS